MMDGADKDILNLIQREFPLEREPFAAIGRELGIAGGEVIRRIEMLKRGRVVRQISAIFDTRVLGYESSLVAAKIPHHKLAEGAKAINSHPGVSHNYERDNDFNLWYTVAVPPDSRLGLEGTVDVLHHISGAEKTRILPTLKLFKIGVTLDMKEGATARKEAPQYGESDREAADRNISEDDRAAIRALQEDVPLTSRPFDLWGDQVGLSYEELLDRAHDLQRRKIMRRFSAVLYHRKAGFRANAMGVWKVPEDRIEEVGDAFAHYQAVSHCYQRPIYEDWPSPWSTAAAWRSARRSSTRWPPRRASPSGSRSTRPASTRRPAFATSPRRWRPGNGYTPASSADSGFGYEASGFLS
jgi:DNA-binding Lrp family transcriptional regulator